MKPPIRTRTRTEPDSTQLNEIHGILFEAYSELTEIERILTWYPTDINAIEDARIRTQHALRLTIAALRRIETLRRLTEEDPQTEIHNQAYEDLRNLWEQP